MALKGLLLDSLCVLTLLLLFLACTGLRSRALFAENQSALPPARLSDRDYFRSLRTLILSRCGDACELKPVSGKGKFFEAVEAVDNCEVLFGQKMAALDGLSNRWPPPRDVPAAFAADFSMGLPDLQVQPLFFTEHAEANPEVWPRGDVDRHVAEYLRGDFSFGNNSYGFHTTRRLREILLRFAKENIEGKHCAVLGSQRPWVEALLLSVGAARVTTIEYKAISTDHPQLRTLLPSDWYGLWREGSEREIFDCVFSFSSVEHAGLGRYQDIVNPWGDLIVMGKLRCSMKRGGLIFLGLPSGEDGLFWNAHRMYGPKRWAQMLRGLEQLEFQEDVDPDGWHQAVAVARKP